MKWREGGSEEEHGKMEKFRENLARNVMLEKLKKKLLGFAEGSLTIFFHFLMVMFKGKSLHPSGCNLRLTSCKLIPLCFTQPLYSLACVA